MNIEKNQKKYGKIIKLFISDKESKNKLEVNKLSLEIGGIVNDKSFGKKDREILIASTHSYQLMKEFGIEAKIGVLGENILVDFNPYELAIGTKLKCGKVILEISMQCPICNHLSDLKSDLPKLIKNDRGIFAKVISSGIIYQNNEFFVV